MNFFDNKQSEKSKKNYAFGGFLRLRFTEIFWYLQKYNFVYLKNWKH